MKINLRQDSLTLGDMEDFESYTGQSLGDVVDIAASGSTTGLNMRVVVGLLWITRRQSEPSFTVEAARALPLSELSDLELVVDDGAAVDPTPASV